MLLVVVIVVILGVLGVRMKCAKKVWSGGRAKKRSTGANWD